MGTEREKRSGEEGKGKENQRNLSILMQQISILKPILKNLNWFHACVRVVSERTEVLRGSYAQSEGCRR